MDETLKYYNHNAKLFAESTVSVDLNGVQNVFMSKLQGHAKILDFGCGSGRDTKYFLDHGFQVDAVDGSVELCRYASSYSGIHVKQMLFQDLDEIDTYGGIWACSSIVHLPKNELTDVFIKMIRALKRNGIIYTSFKYGEFEGIRNGRYFTDFTEDSFKRYIKQFNGIILEDVWVTNDMRPERVYERWLNLILRKEG